MEDHGKPIVARQIEAALRAVRAVGGQVRADHHMAEQSRKSMLKLLLLRNARKGARPD